jgi:osmotically-inducible protein OsmY
MIKRLFALVVLVALVGVGLSLWLGWPAFWRLPPRGLGSVERELGEAKTTASVQAALKLHRDLQGAKIRVSTEQGTVTLRGRVPTDAAARAAVRVAEAVPGVTRVASELAVSGVAPPKGQGRSVGESLDDGAVEVQVRLALSLRKELEGSDIAVRAFRRQVTLTGEVADERQRETAVETAGATIGVAGVTDDLRVRARGGDARDVEARPGGREAAERAVRANPNLAPYSLRVVEVEGRLVLRGTVRTGAERDLAALLASRAAGRTVEDRLQIAR